MATGILNILALNTEYSIPDEIIGFGNFRALFDGSGLVSGDILLIREYQDINTIDSPILADSWEVSFDDLVDGAAIKANPETLQAGQKLIYSLELTAGTVPLNVGYKVVNLQTGA